MKNRLVVAAGLAAGLAAPVLAQNAEFAPNLGTLPRWVPPMGGVSDALGTVVAGPFDIQNPVVAPADNGCLGVASAFGFFWVAGRGSTGTIAAHRIHKFNLDGTYVESYAQNSASAAWGGRDGTANEAANLLYFGEEAGRLTEYSYSPGTQDIAFVREINIAAQVPVGIVRALAFNPTNGHFYTANFSSSIWEFTIDPVTLVATHPNAAGPAGGVGALYGLAYSESTDTIWGWSQNPTAASIPAPGLHQVFAAELNATTLAATGRVFDGAVVPNSGVAPDNIAGGAEVVCDHPSNPGNASLVAVHQATPDAMVVYDLDGPCGNPCYPDCNGVGGLTIADFGCFQTAFVAGDPYADCNGVGGLTIADFGCFQTAFVAGCP
jgi:hypothetical protein